MDEFAVLDATAQSELVRAGDVTPAELVQAAIGRIERLNPSLNAVITPMFEEARSAAGELPDGPFRGVPFLAKDLVATVAGVRMTEGSAYLADHVAARDSELVRRWRRAGLVIVGKTNTPEFGILGTTEPRLFGPTRNPWDGGRSTGGSSGGSAAAVASGMVPMAHANDGGGSVRIPASCCGVFGLKPTRARNPLGPAHGDLYSGLVTEHAVTRSVRDSAALLDATAGPDLGDPYWAPPPSGRFATHVGREPSRLRIAFSAVSPTGSEVHPDVAHAVQDAAELCQLLGHDVQPAGPHLDPERVARAFDVVWSAGTASTVQQWAEATGRKPEPDLFEPLTWALFERGRGISAADYLVVLSDMQGMARDIAGFHRAFDLWLTPTVAWPPPPLGTFDSPPEDPLRGYDRDAVFCPFTPLANMTGQPAMSLPLWWNEDALPIGVHFTARFGDEATLFRLAGQLERARPWRDRWPPLSIRAPRG